MKFSKLILPTLVLFASSFTVPIAYSQNPQIKVGVIIPLTGANGATGTAMMNGIELARQDHPGTLGNITFSYEDDQFDPKRDVTAYHKLMLGERLDVLFGLGPNLVQVLAAALEREQVPLVNFGFVAAPVIGKPLVVRTMNHTGQYMQALADYLKKDGLKEYPIVEAEHMFFKEMTNSLRKGLGAERTVRQIAIPALDEADFRGVILKLRSHQNGKVGLMLFPPSLIAFLTQARELRFTATFFGTDTCDGAATLSQDPTLLDGCIYPDNDASEAFRAAYRNKFGNVAQLTFAANAYDMALLVGEVFQRGGKLKATEFLRAMAEVKVRKGVLGTFSYADTPEAGKFFEYPIYVKRIEMGRGVSLK
jgi:branched-chain amino acid transport system substrate-binding protein